MNTKQYDIIVLGFGKAGKTLAAKFGSMGKSVAMIEENPLMYGGTCINIACIPTKTMIIAASKGFLALIQLQVSIIVQKFNNYLLNLVH